jgi:hypothetical protein
MIYLLTNVASQDVFLSLDEARQYYSTPFTHYLIIITHEENSIVGEMKAQVPNVLNENVRITQLQVSTVGLTLPGRYRYEVYGQNSSSNVDPENAAVVGILERGYVVLTNNNEYFDVANTTINNDIIYGA